MVDPGTVCLEVERIIELEASALDLLLDDWLSELIFLKDRDRLMFPEIGVHVRGTSPYRLEARLRGGMIEAGRTVLGADPKAVTFHQLSVERRGDGWQAGVIIDICGPRS